MANIIEIKILKRLNWIFTQDRAKISFGIYMNPKPAFLLQKVRK